MNVMSFLSSSVLTTANQKHTTNDNSPAACSVLFTDLLSTGQKPILSGLFWQCV
jgi:hypothetical protein